MAAATPLTMVYFMRAGAGLHFDALCADWSFLESALISRPSSRVRDLGDGHRWVPLMTGIFCMLCGRGLFQIRGVSQWESLLASPCHAVDTAHTIMLSHRGYLFCECGWRHLLQSARSTNYRNKLRAPCRGGCSAS
mmetsp:Transcript_119948/g.274840  ORF Transcript_119948/g.274840 Transcript_119948/m.274840 type:complete len:136 (-) Transcript_119948:554-961(-)